MDDELEKFEQGIEDFPDEDEFRDRFYPTNSEYTGIYLLEPLDIVQTFVGRFQDYDDLGKYAICKEWNFQFTENNISYIKLISDNIDEGLPFIEQALEGLNYQIACVQINLPIGINIDRFGGPTIYG